MCAIVAQAAATLHHLFPNGLVLLLVHLHVDPLDHILALLHPVLTWTLAFSFGSER